MMGSERSRLNRPSFFPPGEQGLDQHSSAPLVSPARFTSSRSVRMDTGAPRRRPGIEKLQTFTLESLAEGSLELQAANFLYAPHSDAHHFGLGCWAVLVTFTAVPPAGNPANHLGAWIAGLEVPDGSHLSPWSLELQADNTLVGRFGTHASGGTTSIVVTSGTTPNATTRAMLLWDPVFGDGRLELWVNGSVIDIDATAPADSKPLQAAASQLVVGRAVDGPGTPPSSEADTQFRGKVDNLVGLWFPGVDPNVVAPNGHTLKTTLARWSTQAWPNAAQAAFQYNFDGDAVAKYGKDESPNRVDLSEDGAATPSAGLAAPCGYGGFVGQFTKIDRSEELAVVVDGQLHLQTLRRS